ncbi:DUF1127 domain-containing protein [Ferruginivarius sediminum]|uniref:DUF1127 domain-containing protein n=2 Tax=Ferruginivarius sediminum TaxID=2661937 RepID=A0A369T841_9PROT|nr:DUF1127 domain-containing protein [Ferruginivarius sediminum]
MKGETAMSRKALTVNVTIPIPEPRDVGGAIKRIPVAVWHVVLTWQQRAAERAHLAAMDERMRRDMGLSWEDVRREADKPFWRA